MEKLEIDKIPAAVKNAILAAWPDQAEEIIASLRHHKGFDEYYSFQRWGMFVGIELDGYIHT